MPPPDERVESVTPEDSKTQGLLVLREYWKERAARIKSDLRALELQHKESHRLLKEAEAQVMELDDLINSSQLENKKTKRGE
jgi:hypothetical protein